MLPYGDTRLTKLGHDNSQAKYTSRPVEFAVATRYHDNGRCTVRLDGAEGVKEAPIKSMKFTRLANAIMLSFPKALCGVWKLASIITAYQLKPCLGKQVLLASSE